MWWSILTGLIVLLVSGYFGNMGWGISIVIGVIVGIIVFFLMRRNKNEA
jgi:xanthine/uracil permease